jgi:hypothetical protein
MLFDQEISCILRSLAVLDDGACKISTMAAIYINRFIEPSMVD